eukprot:1818755-Pyramimonas_sp.AAC.1
MPAECAARRRTATAATRAAVNINQPSSLVYQESTNHHISQQHSLRAILFYFSALWTYVKPLPGRGTSDSYVWPDGPDPCPWADVRC